jgi:hypothetical protein
VQDHVQAAVKALPAGVRPRARIAAVAAAVLRAALGEAEAAPCTVMVVPAQAAPGAVQWAVPLLLAAVLIAGRYLSG